MAAIAVAGEATGTDGGLAPLGDRRHEMEQGESGRQLQRVVPFDADVSVLPPARPRPTVLGEQAVEAGGGCFAGVAYGRVRRREIHGVRLVRDHAVDDRTVVDGDPDLVGGGRDPTTPW